MVLPIEASSCRIIDYPVLIVAGPTASGKTALAISLAQKLGGEIVNGDSVQCYRMANIGSAKPTQDQLQTVPHHLIDVLDPDEHMTAGLFCKMAWDACDAIHKRKKLPIVVLGGGLYLTAFIHGLLETDSDTAAIRESFEQSSTEELYDELSDLDSNKASQLHPNDRVRIMRALELHAHSGKAPTELEKKHGFSKRVVQDLRLLVPEVPREVLYERINSRAVAMVNEGLTEEAEAIREKYPNAWLLTSIGYREAIDYLDGKIDSPDGLIEEFSQATRRLAKRQMTFLRNEPKKRGWGEEYRELSFDSVRSLPEPGLYRICF